MSTEERIIGAIGRLQSKGIVTSFRNIHTHIISWAFDPGDIEGTLKAMVADGRLIQKPGPLDVLVYEIAPEETEESFTKHIVEVIRTLEKTREPVTIWSIQRQLADEGRNMALVDVGYLLEDMIEAGRISPYCSDKVLLYTIPALTQEKKKASPFTVMVYLDNGTVYEYDVADQQAAREHSDAIVKGGYRHTDNEKGVMQQYPPHRIDKVKCTGGMTTSYPDRVRGT